MPGEIPSTSISFSSIRSAYNDINSPLDLPQNFSISDLRGIRFVQPQSEITLTTDYETTYVNTGTYNFIVPAGVTEVSAVCVGGGGGSGGTGSNRGGGGGGGGGLAYGTFTVTPGETLTVSVGVGGLSGTSNSAMGSVGGESYIRRNATTLLSGGGGGGGRNGSSSATGGTSSGTERDGGGTGGAGGRYSYNNAGGAGGGGAGYSGNGGGGAYGNSNGGGGNGSGGGGGGGSTNSSNCGGGGGVGLYGEGTSGIKPSSTGQPGTGGSGGTNGSVGNYSSHGGVCGGGGGADDDDFNSGTSGNGDGGKGGVRIIWSPISNSRYYPSTKTATNSVVEGEGGDPVDPISSSGSISINDHLKGNTVATMQPQMTITSSSVDNGGLYGDASLTLTFTSTESTSNFTIDDIIVTKGTLSNFNSVSDKVYTVDLATTGVTNDEHQISVNQGAYTNNETTIGCQNLSVSPFTFTYGSGQYEYAFNNYTTLAEPLSGSLSGVSPSYSGISLRDPPSWTNISWYNYSMGHKYKFLVPGKIVAIGSMNRRQSHLALFLDGNTTAVATADAWSWAYNTNDRYRYVTLSTPRTVTANQEYWVMIKNYTGGYSGHRYNFSPFPAPPKTTTSGNIEFTMTGLNYTGRGSNSSSSQAGLCRYPNSTRTASYMYGNTDLIFLPS